LENELYFLDRHFWGSPLLVALFGGSLFLIVFLRYLLLSSGYHFIISRIFKTSVRKFNQTSARQWRREVKWSILSAAIFTLLSGAALWLYHQGYTKVYADMSERSIGYFFFSIFLLLIGYETYYYWLHRWMHLPNIFRIVHKVHHDSIETSVFTSFSFHPFEAILQFLFLPVFIVCVPTHYYALGIVLTIWTVSAIINHSSVEIFPKKFNEHKIGQWLIGATHHDLHHKEFRTNFGLYFTFWDKWMKTESRNFNTRFAANTSGKKNR
jgi:Delta7-sterol 5-desaturase